MPENLNSRPSILVRDTAGGSAVRGGSAYTLAQLLAWGIGAIAANNGWELDVAQQQAIAGALTTGILFVWRPLARRLGLTEPAA